MYMLARKLGFAEQMFKNIKVVDGAVSAEIFCARIQIAAAVDGYCGQSPERLKAHMHNQSSSTCHAARTEGRSGVGGDVSACRAVSGEPQIQAPGFRFLYNTNLPVRRRRRIPARVSVWSATAKAACRWSYSAGSDQGRYPEFTSAC